jgi:anaerobic selenocysteine-containing dehydrogenase
MTRDRGGDSITLTACPRDCYDSCGIAVTRRDGRIVQVRGNPADPVSRGKLCKKCSIAYNHEWLDASARLTRPLRRTGAKGEGRFEAVSWDHALADIAERFRSIVASRGAQAIVNAHYTGTISLLAFLFPARFFARLGATEVNPDTICNMAGHVALSYMYGTSLHGFDPRMVEWSECILVWGANPAASGPHVQQHWLGEARGKVVVVDPVRTATAAAADIHVQPYPGSDAALAYALLHVIERESLVDRAFVAAHTSGWDEIASLLPACTPAWGEAMTGVPAALIEDVAVLYAKGPSLLWLGQGLQRQATGGNVVRACAVLPAVTGNLARRGAGLLYLNWDLARRGIDDAYLAGAWLASAPAPRISHMDLAACLEDPLRSSALMVWNMNVAASSPEQSRLRRALLRKDLFTVVLDLFPTDTTDYADYVLPAASFLEFDDLIAGYFHLTLSAQVKVAEPPGEALPNSEIFRRLAHAMGYAEPDLYESDAKVLATLMERAALGETFASLAAKGAVAVPREPCLQFEDLHFATPSGRIELASAAAQADGHPRVPQPSVDHRPGDGRLRLLSPASEWMLNSSFGNVAKIQGNAGRATILLHPDDARERGLAKGDKVLVANGTGSLTLDWAASDQLMRGVALLPKGRWPKQEFGSANVNVLNPGIKTDMGESSAVHGVEVAVQPARR